MSLADAEMAYKLAEDKARKARQHIVAIRKLTRNGTNNSFYSHQQIAQNMRNMFNAEKAAKQAKRTLRNIKVKAETSNNHPAILLPHNNLWINYVEEEISPSSPGRSRPSRKTRRCRSRSRRRQ